MNCAKGQNRYSCAALSYNNKTTLDEPGRNYGPKQGDNSMDQNTVNTSRKQRIHVIGFGRRVVAALLDALLVLFGSTVLALLASVLFWFLSVFKQDSALSFTNILLVAGLLFSLVYFVGFWAKTGQTIGKSTLNIQVVGADGRPISWGRSLARYFGYIINVIVASIGFLWIVFDSKRQGWHDKIAGTYVVSGDDEPFKDINVVEIIPSDHGKGNWIWVVLWLITAFTIPSALFSGFLLLGPVVNRLMHGLLGG